MSIVKPDPVVFLVEDSATDSSSVSQCVIAPLEESMAITLGNSLRRVLLTSLQGAAITFIKIKGVEHEFQSIAGVKEDVTDIILNIKSTVLKMLSAEKQVLRLSVNGPSVVTAGMIEKSDSVQIINPDHVICTLSEDASIDIEMICEVGRGYLSSSVAATAQKTRDYMAKGYMAVDAAFSPVTAVQFKVDSIREGQHINREKLTLTIETNGSTGGRDALSLAASILQEQLSVCVINSASEYSVTPDNYQSASLKYNPVLLRRLDSCGFSVRAMNCFVGVNAVYLGDLVQMTEAELTKLPNFGKKSLNEVLQVINIINRECEELSKQDSSNSFEPLYLGMKVPDWSRDAVEKLARKHNSISLR